jgi:hypothetical protein
MIGPCRTERLPWAQVRVLYARTAVLDSGCGEQTRDLCPAMHFWLQSTPGDHHSLSMKFPEGECGGRATVRSQGLAS